MARKNDLANANEEVKEVATEEVTVDPGDEIVSLTIPIDYSRPNDTQISIQVNGQTIIVQRGKTVNVKRKFAEAYNNAQQQRGHAIAVIAGMIKE